MFAQHYGLQAEHRECANCAGGHSQLILTRTRMKTHLSKSNRDKGGALLAIAIVALIVAGLLSAYLLMVSHEMMLVQRSQTWNNGMSMAESGVEEGLVLINENVGNPNANWITNALHDGWDTNDQAT